jgi:hypothetical protein
LLLQRYESERETETVTVVMGHVNPKKIRQDKKSKQKIKNKKSH